MKNIINISILLIPMLFAYLYSKTWSIVFLIITIVGLFAVIGFLPVCRRRENMWMFFASAIVMLPINIKLIKIIVTNINKLLEIDFVLFQVTFSVLLFFVLISAEEVVFGVLTRIILKNQYKTKK